MDLTGKKILVTRPRRQAPEFENALRQAGAEPVSFPVIEIRPLEDTSCLDEALSKLSQYHWLVMTSVNGVEAVWNRLEALGIEGLPAGLRVAAIGPQTALALVMRGVKPDFIPDEYVAEAILPGLGDLTDRWVLLPRADIARPDLAQAIQKAGGIAHEISAYRTLPAHPDPTGLAALKSGVDVITFTSSSTVRNFLSLLQAEGLDASQLPGQPIYACIGPITAGTARENGLQVDVVAVEYTTTGLLDALHNFER